MRNVTISSSPLLLTGIGIEYLTDETGKVIQVYCDGYLIEDKNDAE